MVSKLTLWPLQSLPRWTKRTNMTNKTIVHWNDGPTNFPGHSTNGKKKPDRSVVTSGDLASTRIRPHPRNLFRRVNPPKEG